MQYGYLFVNGLTLLNAVVGFSAMIVLTLGPRIGWSGPSTLYIAALLISWALLPDILDGAAARKLGVTSEIGAQLDINADTTTFNLATALLIALTPIYSINANPLETPGRLALGVGCALVYLSAGLVRSAKFTVTEPPTAPVGRYFYGMTTNGAALATAALVMVAYRLPEPEMTDILLLAVPLQALLLGPLMVSRLCIPDVVQHLAKGIAPRWPLLLLIGVSPFLGTAASWCGVVYLYTYILPIGNALLRRPLK